MRTKRLIIRWSVMTSVLIAAFWAIYSIFGSVPVVTSIELGPNWTYTLPFGISRWWDILVGPIWSTIIILTMVNPRLGLKDSQVRAGLALGLTLGLVFGLASGLTLGLVFGLALSLIFGLASGLALSLIFGLALSLIFGLAFGLTFGLVAGLVVGLVVGLVAGLAFSLAFGLAAGLVTLLKGLFNPENWRKLVKFMLVRDW